MKKLTALFLALAMCLSLAACGGASSSSLSESTAATPAESTTESSDEEITLTFWTLALQPTFTDFIQGLIDEYEAENPNIKIDWQDLPYDGIGDKFLAQTAGGNPPDIINLWSQIALTYAAKGALLDVNSVATDEQKDIYLDAAYNSAKLGDGVYALPWYATPNIMVYNKELYEQGGITEVPTTYDELFAEAKDFKDKTGSYLFTPPAMYHLLIAYGIPILNEDNTAAAFNTPEAVELLTTIKELGDANAIQTETGSWDNWDQDRQLYAQGMLATVLGGPQTVSRLKDEAPESVDTMGVSSAILGPAKISSEAIMNLCISSGSKHPKEAVDFANWITNDENQLAFCHEVSIFPTTKVASDDPFFSSDTETVEGQANYYASISAKTAVDNALGIEQDQDIKDEVSTLSDKLFAEDMTPEEALAEAERNVNTILSQAE